MTYCDSCEYYNVCDYAGMINFCEDCRESCTCGIRFVSCLAGHDIECNNGFELKSDYGEDDEDAEESEGECYGTIL